MQEPPDSLEKELKRRFSEPARLVDEFSAYTDKFKGKNGEITGVTIRVYKYLSGVLHGATQDLSEAGAFYATVTSDDGETYAGNPSTLGPGDALDTVYFEEVVFRQEE